jgi:hypothetical protein
MGQQPDALNLTDVDTYPEDTETNMTMVGAREVPPAGSLDEPAMAEAYPPSGGTEDASDDELEAQRVQIEQTRAEMSQTIDAIQEKLAPGHLANQAKDAVRDATVGKAQDVVSTVTDTATGMVPGAGTTARDVGSGLWDTIRGNPVPVALAGIGIGWLLVSSRQNGPRQRAQNRAYTGRQYAYTGESYPYPAATYPYPAGYRQGPRETGSRLSDYPGGSDARSGSADGMLDSAGRYAGQAQNAAAQAASGAQQAAGQMMNTVQDTAGQMVDQVQSTASGMAAGAQQGMQQAQSGFQDMMESAPLAVAAGAVALGIAVGLAIPETERENELMGPARDALVEQAQQTMQETVQEKVQQVQSVAEQTVGAIKNVANLSSTEQS